MPKRSGNNQVSRKHRNVQSKLNKITHERKKYNRLNARVDEAVSAVSCVRGQIVCEVEKVKVKVAHTRLPSVGFRS